MAAATPRAMRDVTIFNDEATTFNRFWSYRSAEVMKFHSLLLVDMKGIHRGRRVLDQYMASQ
jgi:hypothetical protein